MKVLVGCEESQAVCKAFRERGHEAYSCDLKSCSGGHPEWHLQMDVFEAIKAVELVTQSGIIINIHRWDMGIFFPDCTFLTCSAEWAYNEKLKPLKSGKLVGIPRQIARDKAIEFFMNLVHCGIDRIAIENPIGVMSTHHQRPTQIIQPYQFGEDASKSTCLWLRNLPALQATQYFPPRIVNGLKRWANQTDSGQNKLGPSDKRAELRSKTYYGIAKAMAEQWA